VERSLSDLLGPAYTGASGAADAFLNGEDISAGAAAAVEKVDFYPEALRARLSDMLDKVGTQVIETTLRNTAAGAHR
jgi:hypothetical protein